MCTVKKNRVSVNFIYVHFKVGLEMHSKLETCGVTSPNEGLVCPNDKMYITISVMAGRKKNGGLDPG